MAQHQPLVVVAIIGAWFLARRKTVITGLLDTSIDRLDAAHPDGVYCDKSEIYKSQKIRNRSQCRVQEGSWWLL